MHYYKFFSVLQDYDKITNFNTALELNNVINLQNLNFGNESNESNESNLFCISLSGGVDSMVLLDILHKQNKQIIAIHINYNNREETKLEEEFLRIYCQERNITFICHSFEITRGSIKRHDYETYTKNIKFQLYQKVLKQYNLDYILLAHHKDDIVENILTNFCRGRNFLDLSVIKYRNKILDVNIVRPLINFNKDTIYNYAHYFEVPYFLDTTPDWSVRGTLRRQIFPLLYNTFNGINSFKNNLLKIAQESSEWSSLIQTEIIDKYFNTVVFYDKSVILINDYHKTFPLCFWQVIINKIFHKYGKSAPSRKSLLIFYEKMNGNFKDFNGFQKINLKFSKDVNVEIFTEKIIINF